MQSFFGHFPASEFFNSHAGYNISNDVGAVKILGTLFL
jgi:hypothetical protein